MAETKTMDSIILYLKYIDQCRRTPKYSPLDRGASIILLKEYLRRMYAWYDYNNKHGIEVRSAYLFDVTLGHSNVIHLEEDIVRKKFKENDILCTGCNFYIFYWHIHFEINNTILEGIPNKMPNPYLPILKSCEIGSGGIKGFSNGLLDGSIGISIRVRPLELYLGKEPFIEDIEDNEYLEYLNKLWNENKKNPIFSI
jgi:hypothetical protein